MTRQKRQDPVCPPGARSVVIILNLWVQRRLSNRFTATAWHRLVSRNSLKRPLGCWAVKNGTYAAFQMGGLPTDLDLGPDVLQQLRGLLAQSQDFVCTTFLKDLEQVARTFAHWKSLGAGTCFLCLGDFVQPHDNGLLFPNGVLCLPQETGLESLKTDPARTDRVKEEKNPAWHLPDAKVYGLDFGRNGPVFHLAKGDFHWISPPRHGNAACETGPLARILGAFAGNRQTVVKAASQSLNACGMKPRDLNSALGRLLSRGIEASILAQSATAWLDELEEMLRGKNSRKNKEIRIRASGTGTGTVEVCRGTLTHTIGIENNRIVRHEYLTPSQWNLSPRDSGGRRGPLEQALLGTPVFNPDFPLEILRIVQGFDPCNACHVVVNDLDTGRISLVKG